MPLFYFQLEDDFSSREKDAWDLKDLATAKCAAVRYAGEILCDAADTFWNAAQWKLTVTDEAGLTLFTLELVGTDAPALSRPSLNIAPQNQQG
jgi:hypothetical protein